MTASLREIAEARNNGSAGWRMALLLERLFAEAPQLTDARGVPELGQAPALECHIRFRGGDAGATGVLSRTGDGMLRMLCQAQQESGRPMMIEHFFDYDEIAVVSVFRVSISGGRSMRPHSSAAH